MNHVQTHTRRAWATLAAVLTGAGLLAGASGCTPEGLDGKPGARKGPIRVTPADGSRGVRADDPFEIRVPSGRLESVKAVMERDAQEYPVPGRISADGLSWRPTGSGGLSLAARYTVDVVALDGHGRRSARHTTFMTYVPEKRFIAYVMPENRSTVGTGMIVSLEFNRAVENRAAVERAIEVTARPAVEIRPHWFGSGRVDFRPRRYWKPGTRVTVRLRLRDVEGARGVYGLQHRTVSFTVGRHQASLVDAAAHTLQVRRNGALRATLPVTAGARGTPTYNGKMVVTEMLEVTRMDGATVGFRKPDGKSEYDIADVPHAMRLTASGTFLHGNYWASRDIFGRVNATHGCVGLRDVRGGSRTTPAGWFFDRSLVGDVVEVVNSSDRKVAPDNGLGGWNMGWKEWKAGGAVK